MKSKANRRLATTPAPTPSTVTLTATRSPFVGSWIGETMGTEGSPAHIWEIKEQGLMLRIQTKWEGQTNVAIAYGKLIPNEAAFIINEKRKAILIDPQHFWVEGWDTNDIRGGEGPHYDVVFSRPGLAELSAREAWEKAKKKG